MRHFIWFRSRLANRLLLAFLVATIGPILLLTAVTFLHMGSTDAQVSRQLLQQHGQDYGTALQERLMLIREYFVDIGKTHADARGYERQARLINKRYLDVYKSVPGPLSEPGDGLADSLLGQLHATQLEYLHQGGVVLMRGMQGRTGRSIMMLRYVEARRRDQGLLIGVVNPDYLWPPRYGLPSGKRYCVLSRASLDLLYCSTGTAEAILASLEQALGQAAAGSFVDGEGRSSSYWSIPLQGMDANSPLVIVISDDASGFSYLSSDYLSLYLLVLLVAVMLAMLISSIQIRRSLKPLEALMEATRQFGTKQFPMAVVIDSKDEFQQLGQLFNEMAGQINQQIATLSAMSGIDQKVMSSTSLELIGEQIGDDLMSLFGCNVAGVGLATQPFPGHINVALYRAGDERHPKVVVDDEKFQQLIKSPMRCIPADPGLFHDKPGATDFLGPDVRCLMAVVVRGGNRVLGLLVLGFGAEKPDAATRQRVLEYTDHLAVALSNSEWQRQLYREARFDPLTGLANRTLLQERLAEMIAQADRQQQALAAFFVDLDNFKAVNDAFGHEVGDLLLSAQAQRLKQLEGFSGFMARLGGDEFFLLMALSQSGESAHGLAQSIGESIQQTLRQPIVLNGHEVLPGGSVGVALYPDLAGSGDELIRLADQAMYLAKASGTVVVGAD